MYTKHKGKRKGRKSAVREGKGERAQAISKIRKELDEKRSESDRVQPESIQVVISSDDEDDTNKKYRSIKRKGRTKLPQTVNSNTKGSRVKVQKFSGKSVTKKNRRRSIATSSDDEDSEDDKISKSNKRKKVSSKKRLSRVKEIDTKTNGLPTLKSKASKKVGKKGTLSSEEDPPRRKARTSGLRRSRHENTSRSRRKQVVSNHNLNGEDNGIASPGNSSGREPRNSRETCDIDSTYEDYKYMVYLDESSGYFTKALFQIISQCLTTCCLCFDASGMYCEAMDDNNPFHVAMKLTVPHNKCKYMWGGEPDEKRIAGIAPADLSKILRCIRRKFTVRLYELKSSPDILNIAISMDSKSTNNISIGQINIFTAKVVDLKLPDVDVDNIPPIVLDTSFFQSALNQARDVNNKQVNIWSKSHKIVFESEMKGFMGRRTESGDIYPAERGNHPFSKLFSFTILDKFRRVSTLSGKMRFYLSPKYEYLRFILAVGDFGELEVIINNYSLTHSGGTSKKSKRR